MNLPGEIWQAPLERLKQGYIETEEHYTCLCCGRAFEQGIIYPEDGLLYEAERYTRRHIEQEHGSVFAHLVGLDKSLTGLSDLQKRLLLLFYEGKSDVDVQKELGIGSTSTIRNHRFQFKERARQAKLFLAIMELLLERDPHGPVDQVPVESPAASLNGGGSAHDRLMQKYFPSGPNGPLKSLKIPAKHGAAVLGEVAKRLQSGRIYTEAEIDHLLAEVATDYVTLRRQLVDHGFVNREPDGSQYWLNEGATEGQGVAMDRKRELKRLAKETKTEAGIYSITNSRTGQVYVESTPNLKTMNGKRFQLENGSHPNKELQQAWDELGPDAFSFAVLEVLKRPETGYWDETDELKRLKARWVERLAQEGGSE